MMTPNKTKNPHDPTRTPGGSSSGSCAAVGDNMALLALGSQTGRVDPSTGFILWHSWLQTDIWFDLLYWCQPNLPQTGSRWSFGAIAGRLSASQRCFDDLRSARRRDAGRSGYAACRKRWRALKFSAAHQVRETARLA